MIQSAADARRRLLELGVAEAAIAQRYGDAAAAAAAANANASMSASASVCEAIDAYPESALAAVSASASIAAAPRAAAAAALVIGSASSAVPAAPSCASASSSSSAVSSSAAAAAVPHFVKFPRTHHLLDTGGAAVTRDDLVCDASIVARFCNGVTRVCVQEKVDGANLGFSLDETWTIRAQNRCV